MTDEEREKALAAAQHQIILEVLHGLQRAEQAQQQVYEQLMVRLMPPKAKPFELE